MRERRLIAGITNKLLSHPLTTTSLSLLVMQSDRSPLHWAASEGDQHKVAELLEQKVDVDPVDDVSMTVSSPAFSCERFMNDLICFVTNG
jgi:ankyrin repeat protein